MPSLRNRIPVVRRGGPTTRDELPPDDSRATPTDPETGDASAPLDEETAVALTHALVPDDAGSVIVGRPRLIGGVLDAGRQSVRLSGEAAHIVGRHIPKPKMGMRTAGDRPKKKRRIRRVRARSRFALRRVIALMAAYVKAIQSTGRDVRDKVMGQLRAVLHAMPSPDVGAVVQIVLRFVVIESASPYLQPPGALRLRGVSTHMSDTLHVYVDMRLARIDVQQLLLLLTSIAQHKIRWFPFIAPGPDKLLFFAGGEPNQPYLAIIDGGTPANWREELCVESSTSLRCCKGAAEREVKLGDVIPFLAKYGVFGRKGKRT